MTLGLGGRSRAISLIHGLSAVSSQVAWALSSVRRSAVSGSLRPHGLWLARLLCPWYSPGKNAGVDCHSLLQRIFLTQGWNSGLLPCRQVLYHLSYKDAPWALREACE